MQRVLLILQFTKMVHYKSSFAKFMTEDEMNALVEAMDGEAG